MFPNLRVNVLGMRPLCTLLWLSGLWLTMAMAQAQAQAQAPIPGQTANGDKPEDSAIWQKVRASLFQDRPIATGAQASENEVIALLAPARAEDAAIVPIAIHARFAQTPARFIRRLYLVIDNNPSPISATFEFTPLSGRADLETRVRIEQYTWVRAIAETNDGQLFMALRYVKASGGCSAPPGKDPQAALANLGRMRLQILHGQESGNSNSNSNSGNGNATASEPVWLQLMVNHPNISGLAMDQLTRLYAPAHFVRELRVRLNDAPVLSASLDISISENPHFRFFVLAPAGGVLKAEVLDSQDRRFETTLPISTPVSMPVSEPAAEPPLKVLQVAPGVYLVPGAMGEPDGGNLGRIGNAGFVVGDAGVVAIDTGTSYRHGQALLRAIQSVTDKQVELALVTHTRPEFLFGAAAFQAQGIPVYMQPQAAELMRARCERCLKKLQTLLGADAMQGTVVFKPDHEFNPSFVLHAGGRKLQLLYYGHSSGPGDVAVLDEQTGVLFAGGLLDNQHIPELQDGDLAGWATALQALRHVPFSQIVPGHGPAGGAAMIDAVQAYLAQMQARVRALMRAGTSLQAIPGAATLPAFASWDGYDTVHQRNASTLFLRLERELDSGPSSP